MGHLNTTSCLTSVKLKELFLYNPETGEVSGAYKCSTFGYMMLPNKGGSPLRVHRVIWELEVGKIPKGYQIDHINGVKHDNRLTNLRLATNQENSRNRVVGELTNIDIRGSSYRVKLCINYKTITVGTYKSLEEAQYNRDLARAHYYGEFNGRKEKR